MPKFFDLLKYNKINENSMNINNAKHSGIVNESDTIKKCLNINNIIKVPKMSYDEGKRRYFYKK